VPILSEVGPVGLLGAAADILDGAGERFPTPGALAMALNPKTVQTPALDLVDAALVDAFEHPGSRLIITMPPQEGKSTRVGQYFPLWVLQRRPQTQIMMVSYADSLVKRNSRKVRDHVRVDGAKLGLAPNPDAQNLDRWELAGPPYARGALQAVSINGQMSGHTAELMIIDDPHKGPKDADSKVLSEQVWDWWSAVGNTRLVGLDVVVLILTRWRVDDLAGRLLAAPDGHRWKVLNIPAEACHDPERGEVDILGRKPGEFMQSATRRLEAWPARKVATSPRDWEAMYQGSPTLQQGGMFPKDKAKYYEYPIWVEHEDGYCEVPLSGQADEYLMASWDMTFKDTKKSDYVVGQMWLVRGVDMYLLEQVRGRMPFTEAADSVQAMGVKWPQCNLHLIEDKANGSAVLDVLSKRVAGMVPVTPTESKEARAAAVSPFWEAGNVHLPRFLPCAGQIVTEAANFPYGQHDDQVDAMTQALRRGLVRVGQGHVWMEYLRRKQEEETAKAGKQLVKEVETWTASQ
jgi:predicted phage terminase large subunit-like protein